MGKFFWGRVTFAALACFCALGMISAYRNWKRGYVEYHPNNTFSRVISIDGEKSPTKFKLFCLVFFLLNALLFIVFVTVLYLGPSKGAGH
jgi:hypothetical protein